MKKKIIFLTVISLFLAAVAVSAQVSGPNFGGEWQLDVSKSKLPETMRVESMTLKVSQTEQELKVEGTTKMAKGDARGGMMRGGGMQTATYSLEGKEMLSDVGSGAMAGKETRKATMTADGKLNLNLIREFKGQMGDVVMKTNEIWELLDAGKTLKVTRYTETPRGATNAEMFFTNTKKSSTVRTVQGDTDVRTVQGDTNVIPDSTTMNSGETPRKISGGVLNGKASSLPAPAYPAAARAVKASGAVNVQVTINEQGDIVSASAVSGHPLLRQAAEQAARQAKFAPTLLQGVPVRVTGVIVYNFVP